ncbi:hypothetical protein TNCV_79521 [Trichonephila clavipes]|nr:hypothetical protein TNCV_79521 [Trichonephila clavipes]
MPCGRSTLLQTASNGTSGHRMIRNRCCAMVRDVAARSITAKRTIHLSLPVVVQRGRCNRPYQSVASSCIQH